MNFYAVIIGTEILNNRREDSHFKFIQKALLEYGHTLFASFIIKDNEKLIRKTFEFIQSDKESVLFSFGGIGSTPDDLTRKISAEVFSNAKLEPHATFVEDIIQRFGEDAYPNRIHMADLPLKADLLFNPVNNMSGFSLHNRYFFVPGFPSMAHPMIRDAIKKHFKQAIQTYRYTLKAKTSEDSLIWLMQRLPKSIELSSLPMFIDSKPHVELSLCSRNEKEVQKYFQLFCLELEKQQVEFRLI